MTSQLAVRVGSQMPRECRFPDHVDSLGEVAIETARRAGLMLDEWQRNILVPGLGVGPDGDWSAKRVGVWVPRQNGKGGIIEALELFWLFVDQVDLVVHTAHQDRTSEQAFKRLRSLIEATPALADKMRPGRNRGFYEANGRRGLKLRDGREMLYTTRGPRLGRGFSAPRLILDEAQALTGDQVAAIMPTLSAMPLWQVWFFGTPPDEADAWCYGLRDDGQSGAPRVGWANWGADLDVGNLEDRARVYDRDLWYQTNPALGIRIEESTVEDESRPSGLGAKFAQERLGVWLPRAADGSSHIPADLWAELVVAAPASPPTDPVLAVEVAPDRSSATIVAAGYLPDGRVLLSVVDSRPGTRWVIERAEVLSRRRRPLCWVIDERSPAASLVRQLGEAGVEVPAKGEHPRGHLALMGSHAAAEAWALMVDGARGHDIAHLDEVPLATGLAGATVRPLAGGSVWSPRAGADISHLRAATNALWGLRVLGPLISDRPYSPLDYIY